MCRVVTTSHGKELQLLAYGKSLKGLGFQKSVKIRCEPLFLKCEISKTFSKVHNFLFNFLVFGNILVLINKR